MTTAAVQESTEAVMPGQLKISRMLLMLQSIAIALNHHKIKMDKIMRVSKLTDMKFIYICVLRLTANRSIYYYF